MEFTDIMELTGIYLLFFATVLSLPLAGNSLWSFFKQLADPRYKVDD